MRHFAGLSLINVLSIASDSYLLRYESFIPVIYNVTDLIIHQMISLLWLALTSAYFCHDINIEIITKPLLHGQVNL